LARGGLVSADASLAPLVAFTVGADQLAAVDAQADPDAVQHNGFTDSVIGIGGCQLLLPVGEVFGGQRDYVGNVGCGSLHQFPGFLSGLFTYARSTWGRLVHGATRGGR